MIYSGCLVTLEKEISIQVHFDTGAEINVISYRFVTDNELSPIASAPTPQPEWMDGQAVRCYGAYGAKVKLTDSWGRTKVVETTFYALDKKGPEIVLGSPALTKEQVHIDMGARSWRYGVEPKNIEILNATKFTDAVEQETVVFALLCIPGVDHREGLRPDNDAEAPRIGSITETPSIPSEYEDFKEVFSNKEAGRLPPHKGSDHAIEVEGDVPFGPLYNLSNTELAALREYIDEALAKGWIRHSVSPAGAPILFVPKKDGGLRLCVDYRGLNKVTKKNRHALPLISETLDRLNGAKRFTKLDLKDAYHRIRIKEGDEWKTAFRSRYGHFEYLVMPFGLTNAPATFQAYINKSLYGIVDVFCVVYLDDILIYSDNAAKHTLHVRKVLERLQQHQLYVNLKKCEFSTTRVEFLGFIITTDGVTMDQRRVDTVTSWPQPTTYREVQVFLGFVNFFRRFIHHYSQIAGPLSSLLKGSQEGVKKGNLEWGEKEAEAFRRLRVAFTEAPLLLHFDPELPIRVETDASAFALAGILSQLSPEGQWRPVAFWSRKMIPAELNYEVGDQELLAIVAAFAHWRHYLEGSYHTIEVLTDHNNLKWFMTVKALNKRQARWAMKLAAYDFNIRHRPGKENPADAPSRRPDYVPEAGALDQLLPTLQSKLTAGATVESPIIAAIRQWSLGTDPQGRDKASTETYRSGRESELQGLLVGAVRYTQRTSTHMSRTRDPQPGRKTPVSGTEAYALHHGGVAEELNPAAGITGCKQLIPRIVARVLALHETGYTDPTKSVLELIKTLQDQDPFVKDRKELIAQAKRNLSGTGKWSVNSEGFLTYKNTLYIPADHAFREELMSKHHDDPHAGHYGAERTSELLRRKYYWEQLEQDVSDYIKSCNACQMQAIHRHKPYGEMQSLPRPCQPFEEITLDFITGLPTSQRSGIEYDAILVVVDRYTKMSIYIPCTIDIDAPALADLFYEQIALRFGLPAGIISDRGPVFTSEFWSEVCYYSKVKRRLSTAFHPQTDGQTERQNQTLERYLRLFVNEHGTNWVKLLPTAQFAYNNARQASIGTSPFQALMGYSPTFEPRHGSETRDADIPTAQERVEAIHTLRKKMLERWQDAAASQAKYYNENHKPQTFKNGERVALSTKYLKLKQTSKKLNPRFIGPFRVAEAIGKQAYRLHLPPQYRVHPVFHVSLLEPYTRRDGSNEPELTLPELVDDEERWEVKEVLKKRKREGRTQFLVRWKGWGEEYDQWIEEEDIKDVEAARNEVADKARAKRKRTKR